MRFKMTYILQNSGTFDAYQKEKFVQRLERQVSLGLSLCSILGLSYF
jgi:hypothetical protein